MMAGPVTVTVVRYDSRAETDCCWCGVVDDEEKSDQQEEGAGMLATPAPECALLVYPRGIIYYI